MAELKNLHQLEGVLTPEDLVKIEAGALLHRQHGSIVFKIKDVDTQKRVLTVQVTQAKNYLDKYLGAKELATKAKEYFGQFFNEWKINTHAIPFSDPVVNVVDEIWLGQQMKVNRVNIKKIVADTGLDNTNVSAWVNGKRPMSQITKALFYYYFMCQGPDKHTWI